MADLKTALEAACLRELDDLPSEAELAGQVSFSPDFERRMRKLIISERRRFVTIFRHRIRRTVVAAIVAATLMASTMSVQAIQQPVVGFLVQVYERFSQIVFSEEDEEATRSPSATEGFTVPPAPDGFTITRQEDHGTLLEVEYSADNGDYFIYTQYLLDGATMSIDTEGTETEPITIGGNEGLWYSNRGINNLIWQNDAYGFWISGTCGFDRLKAFTAIIF